MNLNDRPAAGGVADWNGVHALRWGRKSGFLRRPVREPSVYEGCLKARS